MEKKTKQSQPEWASKLKGEWFNLIWVMPDIITGGFSMDLEDPTKILDNSIICPKGLMDMNKDKAIGSMCWTRKILCSKIYPCFIYCPDSISIFNDDGAYNLDVIRDLIKEQGGSLDYMKLKGGNRNGKTKQRTKATS